MDKNDLKSMKKLLRRAAIYSRWLSIREHDLLKLYDEAEK